jgi:Xaa-Pro aminopeptidase
MPDGPIHAFIIPSEDPHMSEYPPDKDARREFITGFTGSAGTAVVTPTEALLWTDGRYFLQAAEQLGPDWTLMRAGTPGCPDIEDWLVSSLPEGGTVGIDADCHTIESAEKLAHALSASGKKLVPLLKNPIDDVWGSDRPSAPLDPIRVHALQWAGRTAADKIAELKGDMSNAGAGALLVTGLDEVAWLLNLRGSDVMCNPVFISYAMITADKAVVYVDEGKVTAEVGAHLKEAGVTVAPYGQLRKDVIKVAEGGAKIWMDPTKVSYSLKTLAVVAATSGKNNGNGNGARKRGRSTASPDPPPAAAAAAAAAARSVMLERPTPVSVAKAIKNEGELEGLKEAHLRDGVALVKFLSWLDKTIAEGAVLTEVDIDRELTARRAAQQGFVEPSFPTIAGAGSNGAVIHYRAQEGTCRSVDASTMLLLDSGGQYDCGTTDITRTMHFGEPTAHQKAAYTAVLQGHIMLDSAIWPEGTPGCAIDAFARLPLWKLGLNYRHGTGHGVGAALNVHEGPQSISSRFWNTQPLLKHMVCSNEPGYYEDNAFGVRIENLFIVVEAPTEFRFGGQSYYTCDPITVCPIQKKLIDVGMLSREEKEWVNVYHVKVLEALEPRLAGCEEELAWLRTACAPL